MRLFAMRVSRDYGCPNPDMCRDGADCTAGVDSATLYVVAADEGAATTLARTNYPEWVIGSVQESGVSLLHVDD